MSQKTKVKNSAESPTSTDNLTDLFCAGFLLVRTDPVPQGLEERPLLTNLVTSVCECIYPRFPHDYAIDWCEHDDDERNEGFEDMGVPKKLREAAMEWATDSFEVDHGAWGVFFTLEAARTAYQKFLKSSSRVRLIGLGVHKEDAAAFVKTNTPPPQQSGESSEGLGGQVQVLKKKQPLPEGGYLLGFEPLVTYHRVVGCSWLCSGLEEDIAKQLDIKPNKRGLIESYADARRATELINKGDTGAEPGIWMPWALVDYPLI